MKKLFLISGLALFILAPLAISAPAKEFKPDLTGFVPLFDGQTLNGWHRLGAEPDGTWEVKDGVIVGGQSEGGKGGLLVTDQNYGDYELYAEVYTTWPLDTGLFLRIPNGHQHYQITIDYRPTGEIGSVYGPFPGGGGGFYYHCFPGFSYWNPNDFNSVRVRIEGNPPRIQVWIRDQKITDFQDRLYDGKPGFPDAGPIGIQVHPGESWGEGSMVKFRNIMVKELK
ncbi:MAG: DUF1080 domain-containing protein [Candidatus Glassbacteria bacterium]